MEKIKGQVTNLENTTSELKDTLLLSQKMIQNLTSEMKVFKDEMKDFKDEMRKGTAEMNKRWRDLSNKMGTIVEDFVAPNIPVIAKNYFDCGDINHLMIRTYKRNRNKTKRREFDVIAVCDNKIILNNTKSSPRVDHVDDFKKFLDSGEFFDYFPEYSELELIPVFSSLNLRADLVNYLTKKNIYALAMKGNSMDLLNAERIR